MNITEIKRLQRIMEENIAVEINKFQRKTGLHLDGLHFEKIQTMGHPPTVLCSATVKL